ncbi:MAG: hypothetical protein U0Q07_19360 [Acidimicrobiales bacterium]
MTASDGAGDGAPTAGPGRTDEGALFERSWDASASTAGRRAQTAASSTATVEGFDHLPPPPGSSDEPEAGERADETVEPDEPAMTGAGRAPSPTSKVQAATGRVRAAIPKDGDEWRAWASRAFLTEKWALAIPLWIIFGYIVFQATRLSWNLPPYPPDSWTYYELSRGFPFDPMRSHIFRSFISTEPYSAAFPPLWPFAIGITDLLTGTGINAGQLAGAVCMVLAAVFLDRAGYRFFGVRGCGPGALLALFLLTSPLQEMVSSAPVAMNMMWIAALLMVLARPWPLSTRQAVGVGVICGLMALTRFDTLLLGVTIPLLLLGLRAIERRRVKITYLAYAITISPWVLFSLIHFRTPFASDNSQVAMSVKQRFVLDYLPDPVPTVRNDPSGWFSRVWEVFRTATVPRGIDVVSDARAPLILAGIALVGVGVSILLAFAHRTSDDGRAPSRVVADELKGIVGNRAVKLLALLWVLQAITLTIALSTSGYTPPRYFTPNVMLLELALGAVILALPHKPKVGPVLLCCLLLFFGGLRIQSFSSAVPLITGYPFSPASLSPLAVSRSLASCVTEGDRILFVRQAGEGYVFGALTDGEGAMEPSNWSALTPAQRNKFLQDYKIDRLYVSYTYPAETRQSIADGLLTSAGYPDGSAEEVCQAGLYRIKG